MMRSGGKSYPRSHRIASLVRRGVSAEVSAECAAVTVRRVSLNGDYSVATVYYSLLAGDAGGAHEMLAQKAPRFRARLAAKMNMRATPRLVFVPDDGGRAADDMQKLLDSLVADSPPDGA
ncbi:MAG: ribosome-binding factor A [Betaproteobacteria bacterium]|nr:ribosome-binding factor A [Betaproteobacteria bacterium]